MEPTLENVEAVLRANPEPLIKWVADTFAYLGGLSEWSMDHNFVTTETCAELVDHYAALPSVGGEHPDALRFWGQIAAMLGYDHDDMDDEEDADG